MKLTRPNKHRLIREQPVSLPVVIEIPGQSTDLVDLLSFAHQFGIYLPRNMVRDRQLSILYQELRGYGYTLDTVTRQGQRETPEDTLYISERFLYWPAEIHWMEAAILHLAIDELRTSLTPEVITQHMETLGYVNDNSESKFIHMQGQDQVEELSESMGYFFHDSIMRPWLIEQGQVIINKEHWLRSYPVKEILSAEERYYNLADVNQRLMSQGYPSQVTVTLMYLNRLHSILPIDHDKIIYEYGCFRLQDDIACFLEKLKTRVIAEPILVNDNSPDISKMSVYQKDMASFSRLLDPSDQALLKYFRTVKSFDALSKLWTSAMQGETLVFPAAKVYYFYPLGIYSPSIMETTYAIIYGQVPEELQDATKRKRRRQLEELPEKYRHVLETLYEAHSSSPSVSLSNMLLKDQDPMESFLLEFYEMTPQEQAQALRARGIYIPPEVDDNEQWEDYFLRYAIYYRNVIAGSSRNKIPAMVQLIKRREFDGSQGDRQYFEQQVSSLTDEQLIKMFGITGRYHNRPGIIYNIYQSFLAYNFILMYQIDPQSMLNVNGETLFFTPVDQLPLPVIVYGSPMRYQVHEVDEFISSFDLNGSGDDIFNRIDRIRKTKHYSMDEIERLKYLLSVLVKTDHNAMRHLSQDQLDPSQDQRGLYLDHGSQDNAMRHLYQDLYDIIEAGIMKQLKTNDTIELFGNWLAGDFTDPEGSSQSNTMTAERYESIKQLFIDCFFAGMYMRRWQGPGYPYPIRSEETQVDYTMTMEDQANHHLGKIWNTLQQDAVLTRWIKELPLISAPTREVALLFKGNLYKRLLVLVQGESCIRMSSSELIDSGYYYLGKFFQYTIPDYDFTGLDNIM